MKTVIIDVRTKKEFKDGSYPGAINIPSSNFDLTELESYRDKHIALLCYSGNRAEKVRKILIDANFKYVSLLENQMAQIIEGPLKNSTKWTIDRQFRLVLSILIAISLIGLYVFSNNTYVFVLLIVFSGLLYSAISDNCYLKALIANMPWNKKINIKPKLEMN